ncbi:hypothetical protein ACNKHM_10835 [Shigella sonnei]
MNSFVCFTSWMVVTATATDVTADITRHVLRTRRPATDLFLKDIQVLVRDLSMVELPRTARLVGEEGAEGPYPLSYEKLCSA